MDRNLILRQLRRDGYGAAVRYIKKLEGEYLEICQNECCGDPSVGVPDCTFYRPADITYVDGTWIPKGCTLQNGG